MRMLRKIKKMVKHVYRRLELKNTTYERLKTTYEVLYKEKTPLPKETTPDKGPTYQK